MESLFSSWEKFPNLNRGERVEMLTTIDLHPCLLKVLYLNLMGENHLLNYCYCQLFESSSQYSVDMDTWTVCLRVMFSSGSLCKK